ncbi:MAG: dihydroorotate dehydrogenase electron transfer subunit [Synergistales bacterium]|nr:dihydroorotate dehydrogenase electron transfer subunit [Bacteroidales bacterium]MDY6395536.1 dihydroorotate dehydrogenase electron transfer subunit [Bacteroidales bacterium]MDY6402711.1 dihydroorotate dehydrogenase electron transfer subunit [Bacteroidales bacterium]MDY6424209.1 dihydroorotate dehydrogenase electron transfer subunit [Bacteroidales bacterium]MDY6435661.1 dihydroorotate dehydrogenase electron transfer subunit [Synergistales bacterium]
MKHLEEFTVENNISLNRDCFLLALKSPISLQEIKPGQFVNVEVKDVADRILRRPISIHDVDLEKNILYIVVQKVGKATKKLSSVNKGEQLSIIFPLGNGFSTEGKNPLLIGGGVGTAPLLLLAKEFRRKEITPTILIGARTNEQLFLTNRYNAVGNLSISTEDGSVGEKGLVTANSILNNDFDVVYCCGPTPMMKAVSEWAKERNIKCYVSLENRMACGIGACLCCVNETKDGHNVCVCTEGPVFNSMDIKL